MLVKKRGDVDAVRRLSSHREANESRDPSEDKNGEDVPTGVWGGYKKTRTCRFPRINHTCKADSQRSQQAQPALHHLLRREDGQRLGSRAWEVSGRRIRFQPWEEVKRVRTMKTIEFEP